MKINEIAFSDVLIPIDYSVINLSSSEYLDNYKNEEIYVYQTSDLNFFFIKGLSSPKAFLILERKTIDGYHPFRRMENSSNIKGMISILFNYVLNLGLKIIITRDEGLTPDGFNWIKKLVLKNNPEILITDENGENVDIDKLQKEHYTALINTRLDKNYSGPTAILISKI